MTTATGRTTRDAIAGGGAHTHAPLAQRAMETDAITMTTRTREGEGNRPGAGHTGQTTRKTVGEDDALGPHDDGTLMNEAGPVGMRIEGTATGDEITATKLGILRTEISQKRGHALRIATAAVTTGETIAMPSAIADGMTTIHTTGQSGRWEAADAVMHATTRTTKKRESGNSPPCSRLLLSWTLPEWRGLLHWRSERKRHVPPMMLHVSGRPSMGATGSSRTDCTAKLAI